VQGETSRRARGPPRASWQRGGVLAHPGPGEAEAGLSAGGQPCWGRESWEEEEEEGGEPVVVDDEIMSPGGVGRTTVYPGSTWAHPGRTWATDVTMLDASPGVQEAAQEGAGSAPSTAPASQASERAKGDAQAFSPVLASTPEVPGGSREKPLRCTLGLLCQQGRGRLPSPVRRTKGPACLLWRVPLAAPGASPSKQGSGQESGWGSEVRPLRSEEGGERGGVPGEWRGEAENLSGMQGSCAPNPKGGT